MSDVAAIILAAGLSSRFRTAAGDNGPSTKLIAVYRGEPLVRHVARAALASRARPIVVVTGHADQDVKYSLEGLEVTFVHNPEFAKGMASSLKTGVAALPAQTAGAIVLLGDMPNVSGEVIDQLILAFDNNRDAPAVVPTVAGRRGNPVLLARTMFPQISLLTGDVGARPILAAAGANVVEAPVEDTGVVADIDTPDALGR